MPAGEKQSDRAGMEDRKSERGPQGRKHWVALVAALLLLGALLAAGLAYERERLREEQFARLSTNARLIDDNVTRQFEGVSHTLRAALSAEGQSLIASDRHVAANAYLKAVADASPGVRNFFLLDGGARLLATSHPDVVDTDFSQRESVRQALNAADPTVLQLSSPYRTPRGTWSMSLVRVALDERGRVHRMALATLDPAFFSVLLSSVRFDEDVWVALAHRDGTLVMRYPERDDLLGSRLDQPGSLFSRHVLSGQAQTVLTGRTRATGQSAWMAQRTISAPALNLRGELVVAVARDPDTALASWRQLAVISAAILGVIVGVSVLSMSVYLHQRAHKERLLAQFEVLRQRSEDEIRQLAFHDALTDLPNRRLLLDRMRQLLSASVRRHHWCALIFLDLDGFKQLNDQLGHDQGDRLLVQVARRLQSLLRVEDTAARWGGDEFAVVLPQLGASREEAQAKTALVAAKILEAIAEPFDLEGHPYRCTASLGAVLFGHDEESVDRVFKRADEAMYEAKQSGKNAYRILDAAAPVENAPR
jgi:diguanylate cyclase (GGDEF)-like protein